MSFFGICRLILLAARFPSGVWGTLLTFDHIPLGALPRPYYGFIFSASPYDRVTDATADPDVPGVKAGSVAGPQVLLTDGQPMNIQPVNAGLGAIFSLNSAYFTSAKDPFLIVDALGRRHGAVLFNTTFTVVNNRPTLINFDWQGIDEF